jgi:sigma-B regulation protein RsbU (phosphoserine phosphatase)
MWIRSRGEAEFRAMSFKVFRARVIYAMTKMLREPSPLSPSKEPVRETIPGSPHYQIDSLYRPCGQVGGDWLGGELQDDATVWILVADVCGKGHPASIVARGLPLLWRISPANDLRRRKCEPIELLDLLGRELVRCLPDGVFVEATAARLDPSGNAAVGAAGLTRVIFRRHGTCFIALQQFGGHFLGIDIPEERSQQSWQLDPGDELLLATDGFYDQPTGDGRVAENLAAIDPHHHEPSLLDTAHALLKRVWADHPQFDDTTLVGVGFKRVP